jgi:cholesterol transport system auxiliary component
MNTCWIKISAIVTVLLGLTACSLGGGEARAPRQLDLGTGFAAPAGNPPAHRPLSLAPITASALLNDTMVIWRVGENGQPQGFTTYRWAAPPAQLVTQRLIARLSLQGAVLEQGVGGDTPQLRLNLQSFEQLFTPDGLASQGVLIMQAVLLRNNRVVAQKLIHIKVPATSQDAVGGAQALRLATDQAAEQVAQWLTPFLKP